MTVKHLPQFCFRVFRAEAVQTNIPFTTRRLNADMSAAFDPASCFFHQLHERIKSIWPHSQCRVNRNSQRIPTGQFRLIALPFLIRNGFVLRILNDRKMMLTAKLIADFCNKTAGVPHIPEFMRAIQRRWTKYNMIMDMLPIRMCRHNEGVLSVKKTLSQLVANLICFLCRYLSWLKRLPELIGNHFVLLSAADPGDVLIPCHQELVISWFRRTGIRRNKFSILCTIFSYLTTIFHFIIYFFITHIKSLTFLHIRYVHFYFFYSLHN